MLLFSNNSFLISQKTLQCIKLRKNVLIVSNQRRRADDDDDGKIKVEKPVLSDFSFLGNFVRNALWIIQTSWWWIWRIKHLNFLENIILIQMQLFFLFGVCVVCIASHSILLPHSHIPNISSCLQWWTYKRHKILVSKWNNLYRIRLS